MRFFSILFGQTRSFFRWGVLFGVLAFSSASAHPIPEELLQFFIDNPQATETEIQDFIAQQYGSQAEWWQAPDHALIAPETSPIPPVSWQAQFRNFFRIGFDHILMGWDHLVFVLSLILIPITWRYLLLMVSTFTVAHSLTLLLAGTGVLTLSSRLVEPMIALSIIYMALMNGWGKFSAEKSARWGLPLIFVFGLFHGLGFAGSLASLTWEGQNFWVVLASFNLGIEFGQLVVLALAWPIFKWVHRQPKKEFYRQAIAIGMIAIATWWLWERIF